MWNLSRRRGNIPQGVRLSSCAKTKPLKENAIFRLASMTKPITATVYLPSGKKHGAGIFTLDLKCKIPLLTIYYNLGGRGKEKQYYQKKERAGV